VSLEKLCDKFLGIQLDKFFQVADWRIRPLPQGMLDYARSDSHYLIPLYGLFQLIMTGQIQQVWLKEDVAQEEWAVQLKNTQKKMASGGQKENLKQDYELLITMAKQNNEFTIDKVLKSNNRKVNLIVKN
jgi:ribonuclease D